MAILSGDAERKLRAGWEFNVSPEFADADGNFERFSEVAAAYPVALPMVMAQVQAIIGPRHERAPGARSRRRRSSSTARADQMLAPANGELVASLIPGARLELLDGVGHLFFWEQPERVARLVAEHVAAARAGAARGFSTARRPSCGASRGRAGARRRARRGSRR